MNALLNLASQTRPLNRNTNRYQSFRTLNSPNYTMKGRQEPERKEIGYARSKKEVTLRKSHSMIEVSAGEGTLLGEVSSKVCTPNRSQVHHNPSF